MKIKKIGAKAVRDSRGEKTILVYVRTGLFRKFKTSSPSGKSKGEHEIKSYLKSLEGDIDFIKKIKTEEINEIIRKYPSLDLKNSWLILKDIEKITKNKIGANALYALEAGILKAIADKNKKELWEFLGGEKIPRPVGNAVGGGLHSRGMNKKDYGIKKPDFQEFLFISGSNTIEKCRDMNRQAYEIIGRLLKSRKRNDEGAWETFLDDEEVLKLMEKTKKTIQEEHNERVEIGLDIAASSFYNRTYNYHNPEKKLAKTQQIYHIKELIRKYNLFYVEDPVDENDFSGFAEINRVKCFICGDDLITTNPERLKKAIRMRSINAVIVKPNQIGSLLRVKEVIETAKKYRIKTVISHRSGETKDDTIADLGVGFNCDFIKTGIYGKVREAKLKRLIEIERKKR